MRTKRPLTAAFKTKVVLEAMKLPPQQADGEFSRLKEQETIASLAQKYEVHPNQITTWKRHFLDNADKVFETNGRPEKEQQQKTERLFEQISRLQVENAFLKKVL